MRENHYAILACNCEISYIYKVRFGNENKS